jgi:hypothetical protein
MPMTNFNGAITHARRGRDSLRAVGWVFYGAAAAAVFGALMAVFQGQLIQAVLLAAVASVLGVTQYFVIMALDSLFWLVELNAVQARAAAATAPNAPAASASGLERAEIVFSVLSNRGASTEHEIAAATPLGVASVRAVLAGLAADGRTVRVAGDRWAPLG